VWNLKKVFRGDKPGKSIRRLSDSDDEAGNRLASDILMVMGINEYGEHVGREALGLVQ
jgi:hypothetical protein